MKPNIEILLVEENPADVMLIDIYLKDEEYDNTFSITVAKTLMQGLQFLEKKIYDIIILDLYISDSSGLQTFHEINRKACGTPLIVLTGLEDEGLALNTLKFGAQDYLVKGKVNSKILKRAINYSIERNKLYAQLAESTKKLEEKTHELLREKGRLAEAQKLAKCGSWEWNIEKNTIQWSDEIFRTLGVSPEDVAPSYEGIMNIIHIEDRDYIKYLVEKSLTNHYPISCYFRIVRPNGSVRIIYAIASIENDKENRPLRMAGTAQDVTDRKREEELEKLSLVASKSFNAVIIADSYGKVEWANDGFTKLSGYTLDDVRNTHGEMLARHEISGLSKNSPYFQALYIDKKPVSYECKNFTKSGKEYWALTSITPILNERGELDKFISIDSDISKQKKAEHDLILANMIAELSLFKGNKANEELNLAKAQLEESLKVKERFLANMSHEIRTPMNAIIGFTKLLINANLGCEEKQYVNAIKTSGDNLLVIINDILDFSKIESGKLAFDSIDFNLPQLCSALIDMMIPKAIEKGIKLSSQIDKNVPEYLTGDPTRLNQIFFNLIGNAIKFTLNGEVSLHIKLLNETYAKAELEFDINDTGIGISAESQARIFESFIQASNDTTRKYGGTGLGLAITKHLVEMQGGSICVKSELNKGSCFSFRMKFKKSLLQKDENTKQLTNLKTKENLFLDGVNVLLVEDNILNQLLAKKVLVNWKCIVDVAANGVIAIEKIKKNNYDIILMDIQLPEMDGYEATRFIRTKLEQPKRDVPIIAMTAHAIVCEAERCIQAGMNDYISKPFDENSLNSKIKQIISERKKHLHVYK
jgi:PAS domain S-box-containing protein